MKVEFADSEAQDHLQALMVIVGRQGLRSSPTRSSHDFSTIVQDNRYQQQQTTSSSSSSSTQTPVRRPPLTTRKRSTQDTFTVNKPRPSVPVFAQPKTTPIKQLEEMARATRVEDSVERKELLSDFEETMDSNITMEPKSPQAEVAPVVSAEQPQEEQAQPTFERVPSAVEPCEQEELLPCTPWTPKGFVEPNRTSQKTGRFVDLAYERRIRAQHRAILKAFPYFVAQELNRPINSLAEADRMAAKYRTHLEQVAKEVNITNFSFDYYIRIRAEEQVRWQGTPSKAMQMLTDTLELGDKAKSHIISLLDSPPHKKKARR